LAQADSLTMPTRLALLPLVLARLLRSHPVEDAVKASLKVGNDAEIVKTCASYMHRANAAASREPCGHEANDALDDMAVAEEHCGHVTFGSHDSPSSFSTALKALQDEHQNRCIGLCDPKCVHGKCTSLQQCTCEERWHGPTCEHPVCEPGCGEFGACAVLAFNHTDGKAIMGCLCHSEYTGDHCEIGPTTTTTTTTTTLSYAECAALAGEVISHANGPQGVCLGEGLIARENFDEKLQPCHHYFIHEAERPVGVLKIEKSYLTVHDEVAALAAKCPAPEPEPEPEAKAE